jgi:hypothetical protein
MSVTRSHWPYYTPHTLWRCPTSASFLLRRDGWVALMASQGFDDAQPAGDVAAMPRLLSRQTVVVGISDGVVLPPAEQRVPRVQLQASLPAPTNELLAGVRWALLPVKRHAFVTACQGPLKQAPCQLGGSSVKSLQYAGV